jgi:fermentation-respiration switch protein FrsA (DUF1100 family)
MALTRGQAHRRREHDEMISQGLRLLLVAAGLLLFAAIAVLAVTMLPAVPSLPPIAVVVLVIPAPFVYLYLLRFRATMHRGRAKVYLGFSASLTLLLLGGVAWIGSERALHPAPCEELPALADYPELAALVQPVHFPSEDGTSLAGWFVPGSDEATILLLHGYRCNRLEMLPHAQLLHDAGYSVLLFDFRNRGESKGDAVTFGYYESGDTLGAVAYLKTRPDVDAQRLGVLGISQGGAAAVLAAARSPDLRAVAVESTFRSLDSAVSQSFTHFLHLPAFPFAPLTVFVAEQRVGLESEVLVPEREVAAIAPRPVFIMHGADDETISPRDGEAIFAAAGEPKSWWLIPGSEHAEGVERQPEEYRRRVVAFFDAHLRP